MPKDEVLRMEIIWLHHNIPIVKHKCYKTSVWTDFQGQGQRTEIDSSNIIISLQREKGT